MDREKKASEGALSRREFLGSTAGAGAITLLGNSDMATSAELEPAADGARPFLDGPSQAEEARDVGNSRPPAAKRAVQKAGSDLMVQVLHDLGIEYVAANPAASCSIPFPNPQIIRPISS